MEETDRLTLEKFKPVPFKGQAGRLLDAMMKGMALTTLHEDIIIIQGRRKTMLNRAIRITAYHADGQEVTGGAVEMAEITFSKRGSMSLAPSKVFKEMMQFLDRGGAIFIEKIWTKL